MKVPAGCALLVMSSSGMRSRAARFGLPVRHWIGEHMIMLHALVTFLPVAALLSVFALGMAAMIVAFDLVWYSTRAFVVSRARRALADGPWQRRIERLTGAVLVGLGVRLAFERR